MTLLFSWHIDSVAAAGLFMNDIWYERRIITIDLLSDDFLESVNTGDPIAIHPDGTVEVGARYNGEFNQTTSMEKIYEKQNCS